MQFREVLIDEQLRIKTTGRDDTKANNYNYPYEATDYEVLEKLIQSGYITKKSRLIDYGCGKGRVSFFLAYITGCKAVGVEYDERLYNRAMDNLKNYPKPYNVSFVCQNAVDFIVEKDKDRFYFFNPFSVEILKSVLAKIKDSYYEKPRDMLMFFYYPSDEYVAALTTDPELSFEDEIDCGDLFKNVEDPRERILIFSVGN